MTVLLMTRTPTCTLACPPPPLPARARSSSVTGRRRQKTRMFPFSSITRLFSAARSRCSSKEGVRRGSGGGGQEGIYRSSLDTRSKPQNPINSEEYQGYLQ
eukprot:803968-Prorocentrum_minimum.AAC.2